MSAVLFLLRSTRKPPSRMGTLVAELVKTCHSACRKFSIPTGLSFITCGALAPSGGQSIDTMCRLESSFMAKRGIGVQRETCMSHHIQAQSSIRHAPGLAISVAGFLWFFGHASFAEPADNRQTVPPPSMEERFKAPIGHRQPTVEDVPAGVLREESTISPYERDLDKKLKRLLGWP